MSNISSTKHPNGKEYMVANYISIEIKGVPVGLNIPIDLTKRDDVLRIVNFFKEFGDEAGFDNGEIKINYFQTIV